MKNQIIIIAIVFENNVSCNQVTEIFDTEYLTQANIWMLEKYKGMNIEYLYVFDSTLNLIERMKLLTNKLNSK